VSTNALARLDRAVLLLKEARTLPDIAKIRAMASAAAEYARAEKLGGEALHYANEIKVRAARKAGELLAEMAERGKRRTANDGLSRRHSSEGIPSEKLSDLRITPKESARWQMLARIPDATFERVLRGEKVPSETRIAKQATPPRPLPPGFDRESLERRGGFMRACRELSAVGEPRETARSFATPCHALDDTSRFLKSAQTAAEWLTAFLDEWTSEEARSGKAFAAAR
jgi:hypothetical protein